MFRDRKGRSSLDKKMRSSRLQKWFNAIAFTTKPFPGIEGRPL